MVVAAFEIPRPEFDGDERRTILYLQHIFGTVLRRTFEVTFKWITSRENPLDDYEKAVRKEGPAYPRSGTRLANLSHRSSDKGVHSEGCFGHPEDGVVAASASPFAGSSRSPRCCFIRSRNHSFSK